MSRFKIIYLAILSSVFTSAGFISFSLMYDSESSQLSVRILDGVTGKPTPVRVRMKDEYGRIVPLPDEAIGVMYGRDDTAEGYAFQPDSAFYVDGAFAVGLEPGRYRIELTKGFEYVAQEHLVELQEGELAERTFTLQRWIDMPQRGWYSADDHIHIRRSPRENPLILKWVAAEDVHVGALLQMGDFWTTYYAQYAWGKEGTYQLENYVLTPGQEDPRTHEIGHTILLNHDSAVRFRQDYYDYGRVFDKVHDLNGLTGYAHQGMSFHGYRGMTLDVLQGKVDFLELLQFCVEEGPVHLDHYYHFLDLGYRLTATAGSDFPWCGRDSGWDAQIGNARFYTYVGDEFNFETWKENLRAGHTFVSSGPMLDLKVNDAIPGDELNAVKGSVVRISAEAFGHPGQVPLKYLEIVAHGRVIARVSSDEPDQSVSRIAVEMELPVERGLWIAARCHAGEQQEAHTTPVYLTIDGEGFVNPDTAPHYLDLSEKYLQEIEEVIAERDDRMDHHAWRHKQELEERIADTREILEDIRNKLE